MRHPELPVASFLCILLLLCSLPSHIRAGSIATISMIAWLGVVSLIRGVNALVWANNFVVRLEVWCDITTKITVGFTYAVPAAALCVLRHLESVASTRNAHTSKSDKRRRQKFEAVMCFGLPMIGMALHYVVQGHRLDLIEDFGCYPPVYFSVAAIFILWVPPFVMSLTTFVYAALSLRHFLRHRIEFAAHLRNSQSSITPTRYFRLMAMAVVEMIWDCGVNAYLIYFNTFTGVRPWTTWDDVHSNFSRVAIFPQAFIPPVFVTQLIWQWWIVPISCVFFFIFFGFGEEAMSDYRAVFVWCRQVILRQKFDKPRSLGNTPTLPTYHPRSFDVQNVDITFPAGSDDSSERDAKPWDELSLKMPQFAEHSTKIPVVATGPPPMSLADHSQVTASTQCARPGSLSLDETWRPASMYTSESSSTTAAGPWNPPSLTHAQSPSIPSLTLTRPDSDISPAGGIDLFSESLPSAPSTIQREPSLASSHRLSMRQSASSDHEITISPAFFPEDSPMSRHHREVFYTTESGVPYTPPTEPASTHLHGGVRIHVEKTVV